VPLIVGTPVIHAQRPFPLSKLSPIATMASRVLTRSLQAAGKFFVHTMLHRLSLNSSSPCPPRPDECYNVLVRVGDCPVSRCLNEPFRRSFATSPNQPPPSEKASQIINQLPSSPNLLTKTGTAVLGTGLAAAAISQELYVVNEETVILASTVIMITFLAKVGKCSYLLENTT
jgi:hypothetical protein